MNTTTGDRRQRASERVAAQFTRVMKASTSPYGFLTDLSMAALFSALPLVMIVRQAAGGDLRSVTTVVLVLIALVPILVALGAGATLQGAREQVIDWMAPQPFAIENINSLLAGISDEFEIHFAPDAALLDREALQKLLDPISDDTLATGVDEEQRIATVKIGVFDSPRLPLRSNHERYVRFQRIVEQILVPLHGERPISHVRMI